MKRIAILTSGGDSQGMNSAYYAVVHHAIQNGLEVYGIKYGYKGLIEGKVERLDMLDVENVLHRGGTALFTSRCPEMKTTAGKQKAVENLRKFGIEGIIVIGGDGSFMGARALSVEYGINAIGIPGTIDNDLDGTDETIGYDTALNTIVDAVDKLRDTATSHERLFFVEVMGNTAGYLALNGALASGAEAAIIPERETEVDQLADLIHNGFRKSKNSAIVLVAENKATGGALGMAERIKKEFPEFDARVTILGHLQRGGSPTAKDRILASKMGAMAIEALSEGQRNVMIGIKNGELVYVPFKKAIAHQQQMDLKDIDIVKILSI